MSDTDLAGVIGKLQKLKALHRARARVQQLERELRGESARTEESAFVPEFLRKKVAGGLATTTGSQRASSERPLILENAQETGRSRRSVRIFVLS